MRGFRRLFYRPFVRPQQVRTTATLLASETPLAEASDGLRAGDTAAASVLRQLQAQEGLRLGELGSGGQTTLHAAAEGLEWGDAALAEFGPSPTGPGNADDGAEFGDAALASLSVSGADAHDRSLLGDRAQAVVFAQKNQLVVLGDGVAVPSPEDGWYEEGGTLFTNNSQVGRFGRDTGVSINSRAWVRFAGLEIRQGQTVVSCKIKFIAASSFGGALTVNVLAYDEDNAARPVSYNDANTRAVTAAAVSWVVPDMTAGVDYETPDLASVLQEIVDRPGWAPGNGIVFELRYSAGGSFRQVHSYDRAVFANDPTVKPELAVVWDAFLAVAASDTFPVATEEGPAQKGVVFNKAAADSWALGLTETAMRTQRPRVDAADVWALGLIESATVRREFTPYVVRLSGKLVQVSGLRVEHVLGERSSALFTVDDAAAEEEYIRGHPVEIIDGAGEPFFVGYVDKATTVIHADGTTSHSCRCVDWTYRLDKRRVNRVYNNMLVGDIVRALLEEFFEAEGVTLLDAVIEDGPFVERAVFDYKTGKECLDILAERAGFWWDFSCHCVFKFRQREAEEAPWTVVRQAGALPYPDLEGAVWDGDSPAYRNRQIMRGGQDVTAPQLERFRGDGQTKTFNVAFSLAQKPTVSVNGNAQTVGIRGIDDREHPDAFDFYWNKGEPALNQQPSAAALTASDLLEVTYIGQFALTTISRNPAAIAAQAAREGVGTGIVDAVDEVTQSEGRLEMLSAAAAKLDRFSELGGSFQLTTHRRGLEPGMVMKGVTIPELHLYNAELLIDRLNVEALPARLRYTVRAIRGPQVGTFARLFAKYQAAGQMRIGLITAGEVETITELISTEEQWSWEEELLATEHACPFPSETTWPAEDLFPC